MGAESNAVERLSKLMRPARACSVALLTDIHSREWRRKVVVSKKLKKELTRYPGSLKQGNLGAESPLIPSQKSN